MLSARYADATAAAARLVVGFVELHHCRSGDDAVVFDSRPSDAIALALRTGSPIFVEDDVVRKSHGLKSDEAPDTLENMRKWLESISPDVLGKYKM